MGWHTIFAFGTHQFLRESIKRIVSSMIKNKDMNSDKTSNKEGARATGKILRNS